MAAMLSRYDDTLPLLIIIIIMKVMLPLLPMCDDAADVHYNASESNCGLQGNPVECV